MTLLPGWLDRLANADHPGWNVNRVESATFSLEEFGLFSSLTFLQVGNQ